MEILEKGTIPKKPKYILRCPRCNSKLKCETKKTLGTLECIDTMFALCAVSGTMLRIMTWNVRGCLRQTNEIYIMADYKLHGGL